MPTFISSANGSRYRSRGVSGLDEAGVAPGGYIGRAVSARPLGDPGIVDYART